MILTLLTTNTPSGASLSAFTSSIDGTYDEYMFVLNNINPSAESGIVIHASIDGGSNYGVEVTTTAFDAHHFEDDSATDFAQDTGQDRAANTGDQSLVWSTGAGGDECCAGVLHLFSPASTTYVKHFYSRVTNYRGDDANTHAFVAGYYNTTSAINAIKISPDSGKTFDGTIQMFGVA